MDKLEEYQIGDKVWFYYHGYIRSGRITEVNSVGVVVGRIGVLKSKLAREYEDIYAKVIKREQ